MLKYILFYSKYSKHCSDFIDKLRANKIDLPIQTLCVDNETVRNKILKSKNIKIDLVPCLLVIQNSSVNKYEDRDLASWIDNIIEQKEYNENKQKLVFNEEPQQFNPTHYVPNIQSTNNYEKQNQPTSIKQQEKSNNESTEQNKVSSTIIDDNNFTSIDEINSEEEYEITNTVENIDNDEQNINTSLVNISNDSSTNLGNSSSNNALNKKRNGLMAMALQMQKSRESEDGSSQKNPYKSF